MIDARAFATELERDGYREIETRTLDPRPANGDPGHHFSIRGLVLDGEFIVTVGGMPRSHGPGEAFEVARTRCTTRPSARGARAF